MDDEAINLLSMKALFRREHQVRTAISAKEGLSILEKESMDIVVSDQRMPPGMSGTQLFASVPDRGRTGIRIILTAYPDDEEVQNALRMGLVDAVLEKPLTIADLKRYLSGLSVPEL